MRKSKIVALVAAALVAGLVLGTLGIASAATSSGAAAGYGLRLGPIFRDAGARMVDVVAKLTGKTVEQVYTERQAGKSLADIAKEGNVSADKVVSEALAARKAVLDEEVKSGQITAADEKAILDRMETRLQSRVTDPSACNGGGGGCGGSCGAGYGRGSGPAAGQGLGPRS